MVAGGSRAIVRGSAADANAELAPDQSNLLFNASDIPSALMYAALTKQDVLCRVFGDCLMGDVIDSELKDLIGTGGRGPVEPKLFTLVRYTADLSRKGLDAMGLNRIQPEEAEAGFRGCYPPDAGGRAGCG
jgi:hypothetical protein